VTHEYPPEETGGCAGDDAGDEGAGAPGCDDGPEAGADEEPLVGPDGWWLRVGDAEADADALAEGGIDATIGVDADTGVVEALVWDGRA
jgi:hypothetical protein